MSTTYTITSGAGQTMGTYSGETAAHALAAMHRDAGYPRVRVEDGEIVFPDADTESLCGGLAAWTVTPVVSYEIIVASPSALGEHLGERILFSTRERAEAELARLAAALEIEADDLHVTERAEAPHAGF